MKPMLKVHNTLTKKKEVFLPRKKGKVGMYVCGPTVYGPGHIGHARTYLAFDFIRRYLEYRGFKVKYIMNITDIHDSIIEESKKRNIPFLKLAKLYSHLFLKEIKLLGIKPADDYPRVTRHIPQIIKFIEVLLNKGFAYQEKESVYFDVSKFKDYGKLSGIKLKKELAGTRIKTDKYEREEACDFALWKRVSPQWQKTGKKYQKEPGWKSPWGLGRPGWHIECSVMSQKYLGEQFDIHGGAKDLIFPHHENEICQSEAKTGKKPFVKYWLHSGLLTVGGKKMSKSLGNYIEISQALKEWPARVLRIFVARAHYRSPIDYNPEVLIEAQKNLEKIDEFLDKLKPPRFKDKKQESKIIKKLIKKAEADFKKAMDDDFGTPQALAVLFGFISKINPLLDQQKLTPKDHSEILKFLRKIDRVFNFIFWGKRILPKIPSFIKKMVKEREEARRKKDWKLADQIREKIKRMGFWIEDTKKGPRIKPIK